jgi:hypothetical protein
VLAMEPTVVYRLAPEVLQAIQAERPMLAAGLHRWVAQVLASRVAHLVGVVQALE